MKDSLSDYPVMIKDASLPVSAVRDDEDCGRISFENAFSPRHFKESASIIIEELETYLANESIRGLELNDPRELTQEARQLMSDACETLADFDMDRLREIVRLYIRTGIQVHSTGVMGRQFSGILPLSGLVDMIGAIVNQPSSFYEAGQLPNVAERILTEEFGKLIGWGNGTFDMVSTSGGSLANLTAILSARNKRYPDIWSKGYGRMEKQGLPAIAIGANGHYSVTRAAGMLGIGEEQIVRLPLNDRFQIDIAEVAPTLDQAIQDGLDVFCIVAAAGSTNTGSFDPLGKLADIAKTYDCWLHVDGAHGGSLLLSDRLRPTLKGLEKVDSFIIDAHKMLFVPSPCTLLFYKNKVHSKIAFRQQASYVFEAKPDIYSSYDGAGKNFECTKRPAIMNLWVSWCLYGPRLFAEKIEYLCDLGQRFHKLLLQQPDFTVLHQPEANIVCFRYTPQPMDHVHLDELQIEVRDKIKADGMFFISKTEINNISALRVVFMNHKATPQHCRMLLEKIRELVPVRS